MMRMKTVWSLLLLSVFALSAANAQEWQPAGGAGPANLEEIKARFESSLQARMAEEVPDANGKIGRGKTAIREGHNYHFDRWYWHAYSHTDDAGNIVSPLKTYQEWEAYKALRGAMKTTNNSSNWTFHGPASSMGGYSGVGRITTVAFHPSDTATFWAATAGGGAWKTTTGGTSWTNMTSDLTLLGTSDVDINPLNSDVIYLCTGDKDAGDTYSIGVMKSLDGGLTWNLTGLQFAVTSSIQTNELVINPTDTAHIVLATSQGIYRSLNGGDTWTMVQGGNFKQLVAHPTDTAVLYAAGAGASSSFIYRSKDGGATWSSVFTFTGSSRARLAVTPAAPNMIKVVAANSNNGLKGIYSSHDTGSTFALIMTDSVNKRNILSWDLILNTQSSGGQGWYDLAIAVSPLDSNTVFVGGVNTWRSINGGTQWAIVNHWVSSAPGVKVVHADKHDLRFHPLKPSVLFECNDGGVYRTESPTSLWSDITNGLGITQFYRMALTDTATYVVAGAQDNGTKKVTFAGVSTDPGGGDGMNCEMDPRTPNTFYLSTQYGNLRRTDDGGVTSNSISNNLPEGSWITPYKLHPANPSVVVAGYDDLYASMNRGSSWAPITTGFNGSSLFRRLALAGNNPAATSTESYVYCLWNANQIRWTSDFGNIWNVAPSPGGTVSDIQVDPWDSTHLWVTQSGYTATQKIADWYANTGGGTPGAWTQRNTGLPNVPIHCLEIDKKNGTKYVGTDVGVFFRDTSMAAWEPYTTGLPSIEVTDININYKTNEIWASTYGRGLWKSPRHITLGPDPTAVTIVPMAAGVLMVAPNPSAGIFNIRTGDKSFWNRSSTIRLYDAVGRVAWTGNAQFDGSGNVSVQTADVAHGTYILEVATSAGALARTRVVLVP